MDIQFSPKSNKLLEAAQRVAIAAKHFEVVPLHLLKTIFEQEDVFVEALIQKTKTNKAQLFEVINNFMARLKVNDGHLSGDPKYNPDFFMMLNRTQAAAEAEKSSDMRLHHLLIGLFLGGDHASTIMQTFDLTDVSIKELYEENKDGYTEEVEEEVAQNQESALKRFAINLVEKAKSNELDPFVGRDDEMRQVIQILSRRTKNNPVVVGEPGVGKTAVTEGLAQRIAVGDVPTNLKDCTLYSLNMTNVIAGAEYRGEFEKRMDSIIKEVKASHGRYILVIDEIHTIIGSNGGEGQTSAADILKPALARGEVSCIGTTTLDEYQKYFEKDPSLERRFQKVLVEEPDDELCLTILRGLKERYENHHKVQITDDALVTAVRMSKRYMTSRAMPDSAIDLIDEACSKIRMEINSKPSLLDKKERALINIGIAITNINPEEEGVEDNIEELKQKQAQLKEEVEELNIQWSQERKLIDEIQALKKIHEELNLGKETAIQDSDTDLAAGLTSKLEKNEADVDALREQLASLQVNRKLIREVVTDAEIAEVISDKTGIPISKMQKSDNERLLNMEKVLGSTVIGQPEAIREIAEAIRINRVPGLGDAKRPIGSFIFLGTTGVGKTHLAKELAVLLFDDESAMIRVDMSEFSEKHAVSRLVGAPPGYVGYEEGGQLTEPVRNKPFCILLLDEVEKAHADMWNILLQVLDDGRLTDSQGREVNFKNAIIIMTSNIGSSIIQEAFDEADNEIDSEAMDEANVEVMEEVKKQIKPEVLNRIDEVIMFNPLDKAAIELITNLELKKLRKNMKLEGGYELSWTKGALKHLSDLGYDPAFGARPTKRSITDNVRGPLSIEILGGSITNDAPVEIDVKDGELVFIQTIPVEEKEDVKEKVQ